MLKKILLPLLLLVATLHAEVPTKDNVTKLYVATFDRAPDASGLDYWVKVSGLQLEQISKSFYAQTETQEKYPPGTTAREYVIAVYANLFNRYPDEAGIIYWAEEIESGRIDRSVFVLAVINGARNTEEYGNDATILTNKTIVGLAFANAGLDDVDDARMVMADVTDDPATVANALAIIEYLTGINPPSISANGLWFGVQIVSGVSYDFQAIVYNNRIAGYSVSGNSMIAGTYTMSDNIMNSDYRAYNSTGYYAAMGVLQGIVSEGKTLSGDFSNDINQNGFINMTFDSQYYNSSSLSKVEGHYFSPTQDFTISSSGNIRGITNGCNIIGNVIVLDPSVNIYDITYILSNCAYPGTYNGLATITTNENGTFIQAGMNNAERMDLFIAQIN